MNNRVFENKSLVIASHNLGKIREIRELLKPLKIKIFSAAMILTPGVIKEYFPMIISPLCSPMFQEVNWTSASLAPIRVG